ncbi:MAG: dipeptide epimerase [Elusimicrobia bacterium]|nr:dipeptide epimerase [Elusimicrobiota bacterium]
MRIESVRALPVSFPLENTFRTSLGEKNVSRNVLLLVECEGGIQGYGESSSSLAMPEATLPSMFTAIQQMIPTVLKKPIEEWENVCSALKARFSDHPTALSAMECALVDAYCRSIKMPLRRFFGAQNKKIETYFTIPALPMPLCRKILKKKIGQGFQKFKIKVGVGDFRDDIQRIALPLSLGIREPVIVDANQGWSRKTAWERVREIGLRRIPVAFLEQPLPKEDIEGLAGLKIKSSIPIAVDESLKNLDDARSLVKKNAADIYNLKIAKSGLVESLRMAEYLKKRGKKLMIGCMMESPIGLAASVHWACGSGDFSYCDLDSFLLLKSLPIQSGFQNRGARLSIPANTVGSGTVLGREIFQ